MIKAAMQLILLTFKKTHSIPMDAVVNKTSKPKNPVNKKFTKIKKDMERKVVFL